MNKKLSLNKEVIATLSNDSMNRVKGGDDRSLTASCDTRCNLCLSKMWGCEISEAIQHSCAGGCDTAV